MKNNLANSHTPFTSISNIVETERKSIDTLQENDLIEKIQKINPRPGISQL